jgi:hypothetical protein
MVYTGAQSLKMNLSDKEQTFLVRGLDKATTPDEADTCAKNFFKELRKRGIDGYRFIDQMDYAEYEREIDEESVKSNQAWDKFYRTQAAQEKAAWEKSQKVNSQNSGSTSGSGDVPPPKTAQAQPKGPLRPGDGRDDHQRSPQKACRNGKGSAEPGSVLTWILMLVSFGTVFLFTHNFIATLILGWLLTCALYAFQWLRRILGGLVILCALVIVWALFVPKPTPALPTRDWRTEQRLEQQRYAEEYIRTHPPSKAVIDAVTRAAEAGVATPTPTPIPMPMPGSPDVEKDPIQLDPSFQPIPVTGQPSGVALAAAPVKFQDLRQFLAQKREQTSAPRAELVKLPTTK